MDCGQLIVLSGAVLGVVDDVVVGSFPSPPPPFLCMVEGSG